MAWDALDFSVAGALVAGSGVACALAARRTGNAAYRAAVGVALASAVILVWVSGAVGIVGTEGDAGILMHGGVLAVGLVGAVVARFRPDGMALALIATALAQASAAAIALIAGWGSAGPVRPCDILISTAFFAALWLASAQLFRNAARGRTLGGPAQEG